MQNVTFTQVTVTMSFRDQGTWLSKIFSGIMKILHGDILIILGKQKLDY